MVVQISESGAQRSWPSSVPSVRVRVILRKKNICVSLMSSDS